MALHEQSVGASDEWYTPAHVFEAMGVRFDLDVAAGPYEMPWERWCYRGVFTNSLSAEWRGFVWMNPPFGGRNGLVPWLEKFMAYGNGVALVPDRTSAPWWQAYAPQADLVLFAGKKIHFIPGPGIEASSPAQGTTLLACGPRGCQALQNARSSGLGSLWRTTK